MIPPPNFQAPKPAINVLKKPFILFQLYVSIDFYFFPNFIIIATMATTTASTINIPKPIPALKIPSTRSQDVNKNEKKNTVNSVKGFAWVFCFLSILR